MMIFFLIHFYVQLMKVYRVNTERGSRTSFMILLFYNFIDRNQYVIGRTLTR